MRAGDIDGLGRIYDSNGTLIPRGGEQILSRDGGWDLNVLSPWRRFLPHVMFAGFNGKAASQLYVTSRRIVLLREIDVWRELKADLTPLNLPNAAAAEGRLKAVKEMGAREYCEINPSDLRVVRARSRNWPESSWVDLRLIGTDRKRYAITLWKTDGKNETLLELLLSRFRS